MYLTTEYSKTNDAEEVSSEKDSLLNSKGNPIKHVILDYYQQNYHFCA